MFCLSFCCVQNSTNLEKILFTIGKLRNYVSLTAAQRSAIVNNANTHTTVRRQQKMSRYSANTIMPHFKEFRLTEYDIIGFDLDGTLLRYDLNNMAVLEHELLKSFLVKEKNYPEELLNQKFESDFLQKGLIIDSERGNILKLSENGTILRASHGTNSMSEVEIRKVYGASKKWDVAQEYIKDPLSAWNGPIAEKLRTLLDYFDIGASLVFAQAVDIVDKTESTNIGFSKNDYKVWPDILAGLIKIYSRENFASGKSGYFEALKNNPDKYLLRTDGKVLDLLRHLRDSGKAVYLLTGSNIDFANFTASYALGPRWHELFDYTIGFAKKPGFFFAQRNFLNISHLNELEGSEISLNELLKPNTCYSQGNWQQLKNSICKHILHKDPKMVKSLYVGDNLIQDIYTPQSAASMDTLALSEEMFENDESYPFKEVVQSAQWGSYFGEKGTPSLWSSIIEKYSQLCVSHINVIAEIPIKDKFTCNNRGGYFPNQPEGL